MKSRFELLESKEWFKGNEIAPGSIETPGRLETPAVSPTTHAIDVNRSDRESLSDEREAQLERWMEEVKEFIRKIDVNTL